MPVFLSKVSTADLARSLQNRPNDRFHDFKIIEDGRTWRVFDTKEGTEEEYAARINAADANMCPRCRAVEVVNTGHGDYCPDSNCKWGWEVRNTETLDAIVGVPGQFKEEARRIGERVYLRMLVQIDAVDLNNGLNEPEYYSEGLGRWFSHSDIIGTGK
jgi:hypothetical protein